MNYLKLEVGVFFEYNDTMGNKTVSQNVIIKNLASIEIPISGYVIIKKK